MNIHKEALEAIPRGGSLKSFARPSIALRISRQVKQKMTRSLHALKARAEKRGKSIQDQRKADWAAEVAKVAKTQGDKKDPKVRVHKPSENPIPKPSKNPNPKLSHQTDIVKPDKKNDLNIFLDRGIKTTEDRWTCPACNNCNFANRNECFRCRGEKPSLVDISIPVKSRELSQHEVPRPNASLVTKLHNINFSKDIVSTKVQLPRRDIHWAPQSDDAVLARNQQLREWASNPERENLPEWTSLNEEDRSRAMLLLERSKRNEAKRQMRQQHKMNAKRRRLGQ